MFTPSFILRGEHSLLFRRMAGRTENFTPRGQLRPWGSKFAPKGEVKNGPLALAPRLNNLENCRVANFFLVQQTNMINNLPTWPQKYQIAIKYTKMVIKFQI
jgi:hypothetical protein